VTFRFVDAEKANHPITVMCCCLGVSTSSFYEGTGADCRRPTEPARWPRLLF
jgi:hypothetical protein